jgi:hypothetical protein
MYWINMETQKLKPCIQIPFYKDRNKKPLWKIQPRHEHVDFVKKWNMFIKTKFFFFSLPSNSKVGSQFRCPFCNNNNLYTVLFAIHKCLPSYFHLVFLIFHQLVLKNKFIYGTMQFLIDIETIHFSLLFFKFLILIFNTSSTYFENIWFSSKGIHVLFFYINYLLNAYIVLPWM